VAAEFLRLEGTAPPTAGATPEAATPEATPAAAVGSGLIWPVSGGPWEIMQGYNGSSHQNQDDLWQYYYSLDLVRSDGGTAGQTVVSPASGTVRWTDPSSGGISIDIGNGHAVALYHVAVDPSIAWGDLVAQGQLIGTVSGPGGPGFAGTPHVHFALWETTDGGNWSRSAAPFVGPYAIAGQEFPDTGGGNQHRGTTFTP
jgi:murein DD-endopeptidase MepM/ murein hydrolase activator NlpD